MQDASNSSSAYRGLEPDPIDLNEPVITDSVDPDDQEDHWEHYVEYIEAKTEQHPEFVQQFYPNGPAPRFAVHALLPRLNELGDEGWQLVHMQPVEVAGEGDIVLSMYNAPYSGGQHTHTYLCAFKRHVS